MDSDLAAICGALAGIKRPVILIDGGSGSGKSELAKRLAAAIDATVVHLDDIYPGWDGLDAGSEAVVAAILRHRKWQRWDWELDAPAEWNQIDRARPLVIEGSGALSRASREHADFGIWVELDEPTRKERALARDGASYESHWDSWAAQELRFFQRERPDLLADLVMLGRHSAAKN